MKLILTQTVTGLGEPGDIVNVKDGYARNFLIAKNKGVKWTEGGQKQVDQIKRAREARSVRNLEHARELQSALTSKVFAVEAKVGEANRLFGSINAQDIVKAIEAADGPKIDRRVLQLNHPIKLAGKHKIVAKLHPEVSATIQIKIG
jgi:large subunit ribosomal protein L9